MTDDSMRLFISRVTGKLRITQLIRPHWGALAIALLAVVGETIAGILEPWPIKIVVDNILQSKDLPGWLGAPVTRLFGADRLAILNFAVASVAAIALTGAVSSYVEKYLTTSVSQWVMHDLRRILYNHIQRLSLAQRDKTQTGDLITRVTSDIEAIQEFVASALLGILVNALTLVGMIGVMFLINWRFTLIALSIAPVLFLVVYSFTRRIKLASRAVRKRQSELVSVVEEVLTSVRVVKAFAREDYEVQRFESRSLENIQAALHARSVKAKLAPIVELIVAAGTCLVLAYGARLALADQLSAGVLVVFLLYLGKMYKPMRELSKMADTVSKAFVGFERIQEVLEIESRVRDLPRARLARRLKGRIGFEHVRFGYDGQRLALKDISFVVAPGQVAAIVGPTGSGKTTVASLIPRFYDPLSGSVTLDGTDVRRYTLQSLREQISFVLQETLLFRAPVWENIAYGRPEAAHDEIIQAARTANAHSFIEQMPDGYDTIIGERGATLSGGERQRIAVARAIIRNTPILILDEPTTGLDAASEQIVVEALKRLMTGKTTVLIAHHLSTVRDADVILVMDSAELVEQGTHESLLAAGGLYAELCRIQKQEDAESPQVASART